MTAIVASYWAELTPAQKAREDGYRLIAQLYKDEELSFAAIREKIGCGNGMIDKALTAYNVERRPQAKRKGRPNRNPTYVRKRNPKRIAKRRVDCARCGLMLTEAPGRVEGLCCLCCEEVARGVIYGGEDRNDFIRWGEAVMNAVEVRA